MNQAPFNWCVECDEVITNPVCSDCLAIQMRQMVAEQDQELAGMITGAEIEGATTCILCGQSMGLCAHCFSKEIYELLQERHPDMAQEFASRFDFDLRKAVADFA